MSNKQKRIMSNIVLVACITIIGLMIHSITALAANVNGSVSSANAVVGDNVTIAVTLSSDVEIFGFDAYVQYDSSKLDYISGSANGADVSGGNGRVRIYNDDTPTKNITINLTFKVKEAGNHSIYLTADSVFYDDNIDNMQLQASTGTIAATNVAPTSNDSTLKDLTVYIENADGSTNNGWYWPAFNKDTLEYYLNVENNAKKLAITATANDSKATVSLSDTNLAVGSNTVTITVRAEDGSTRTYKIIVNKADKPEETTAENPDENEKPTTPAVNNTVNIGDKTYTITNYNEEMTIPEGYEIIDYNFAGIQIKALKGLGTDIILIALSDSDDKIENFVYNETTKEFYKFITVNVKSAQYVILDMPAELGDIVIPESYKLQTIDYAGSIIDAYISSDNNVYIIYAMNWNGEKSLYYLDINDSTIIKYFEASGSVSVIAPVENNSDEVNKLRTQNRIIVITAITIGLIMLGIILSIMLTKRNNKENEEADDEEINNENGEEVYGEKINDKNGEEVYGGEINDENGKEVHGEEINDKNGEEIYGKRVNDEDVTETYNEDNDVEEEENIENNESDKYEDVNREISETSDEAENENTETEEAAKENIDSTEDYDTNTELVNNSLEKKNEEILEVLEEVLEEISEVSVNKTEEVSQKLPVSDVEEEVSEVAADTAEEEIPEDLNDSETTDKEEKVDEISSEKEAEEEIHNADTESDTDTKINVQELLEDDSKSLNDEELEMVLDELLDNILDGDK